MAFIVLRRSRNTSSYYLVESYRDEAGRSRKRTLCYLGREEDGTDTIERAIRHWERVRKDRWVDPTRKIRAAEKVEFLRGFLEGTRSKKSFWSPPREDRPLWNAIRRVAFTPTPEFVAEGKRAFRVLAQRYHPDRGGSHEAFIELRRVYEAAVSKLK